MQVYSLPQGKEGLILIVINPQKLKFLIDVFKVQFMSQRLPQAA